MPLAIVLQTCPNITYLLSMGVHKGVFSISKNLKNSIAISLIFSSAEAIEPCGRGGPLTLTLRCHGPVIDKNSLVTLSPTRVQWAACLWKKNHVDALQPLEAPVELERAVLLPSHSQGETQVVSRVMLHSCEVVTQSHKLAQAAIWLPLWEICWFAEALKPTIEHRTPRPIGSALKASQSNSSDHHQFARC